MSNRRVPVQAASHKNLFDAFLRGLADIRIADDIIFRLSRLSQAVWINHGSIALLNPESDSLVYIGSGATKLIASASRGREQIVAFHFAGEVMTVPAGALHSYTLCALADTDALVFPTGEFLDIVRAEPGVLIALLQRSFTALHRCRDKAVALGRKNAQERLASFLVGMADRIGSAKADQCWLDLPMSRRDIGDSLGLTIETVSRQLSELRSAGLVETVGRSRVLLCDVTALGKRAGHY